MPDDRRKNDDKIDELITLVTTQGVLGKQVHEAVFGKNGNAGMKAEWDRHKGSLQVWKGIAGSGGLIAVGLLILELIRFLR